jgi:hypothetical protein
MSVVARAGSLVLIGLEERNLEKLREGKPYHRHGAEVGLPFDIVIFYGKTEDDIVSTMEQLSGPETVTIDTRNAKKN